jgi:glycerol kinase
MSSYILSLDQGTTSSRAIIFNEQFHVVDVAQEETKLVYPKPGWVEQDPIEIWESQMYVARQLLNRKHILASDIASIGITNQRETTIVWDKFTGKPVYNAIIWQDRRTMDICKRMKDEGLSNTVRSKTGLVIDSYFSATKLYWILENVPGIREKAEAGKLLFGTVDTWLLWNLSGGKLHITDFSNASRTMLFNIHTLKWDAELLDYFNIPLSLLPKVHNSSEIYGQTLQGIISQGSLTISGIAGDQQAALFGQTCFEAGMAKNTYGTGCFMLMNTGKKAIVSSKGLITTIAWGINNEITYAAEGSVFVAGAAIQWLRDGLELFRDAAETEKLASEVNDSAGVYVVPAFTGLGAPYWDMSARGAILGLTRGVNYKHLVRATLEAIAYQSRDVLDAMEQDTGIKIPQLFVDGGAAANNYLLQFQADMLSVNVIRPENIESTALGAAYLAALSCGFTNVETIIANRSINQIFIPKMSEMECAKLYSGWQKAVKRCMDWD